MRRMVLLGAALCLCLSAGCSDPHKENIKEELTLFKELNKVLDGIQDGDTFEAAISDLEHVNLLFKDNRERRLALAKQPEKERRALLKSYGVQLDQEMRSVGTHMTRVAGFLKPEQIDRLTKALQDVDLGG